MPIEKDSKTANVNGSAKTCVDKMLPLGRHLHRVGVWETPNGQELIRNEISAKLDSEVIVGSEVVEVATIYFILGPEDSTE